MDYLRNIGLEERMAEMGANELAEQTGETIVSQKPSGEATVSKISVRAGVTLPGPRQAAQSQSRQGHSSELCEHVRTKSWMTTRGQAVNVTMQTSSMIRVIPMWLLCNVIANRRPACNKSGEILDLIVQSLMAEVHGCPGRRNDVSI